MRVDVHLRNGRTTFRFASRADLTKVLTRSPDCEDARVIAQVKHNLDDPNWIGASVRSIGPNSISFVTEVPKDEPRPEEGLLGVW